MTLEAKIIAYLYAKGEPVAKSALARFLQVDAPAIDTAIHAAREKLADLGLTIVDDGKEIDLRTESAASELIEQIRKEEFSKDLGKAGLETLAILLYKGPSSRSEIDYIRGVNSTYTLRGLAMRGLVRRIPNPKDERSFVYEPTIELLSHLGVSTPSGLPDFEATRARIAELESAGEAESASTAAIEAAADEIPS